MKKYLDSHVEIPPHVWFDYIAILSWAGKYQEATGIFERLPGRPPVPEYTVRETARCYRLSGRYEKARELYLRCLSRAPDDGDATLGLLFTCLEAQQLDEVRHYIKTSAMKAAGGGAEGRREELIEQLVRNYPRNPGALALKAELFAERGDHANACLLYEEAASFSPDDRTARAGKYRSLAALGAVSLALEELEKSKDEPEPELRGALLSRQASAYVLCGEPDAALRILEQDRQPASGTDELSVHAGCLKVTALAQKQEWKKVIEAYERLAGLDLPLPAMVKAHAAFAYHCEENSRRAVALCREILHAAQESGSAEAQALAASLLEEYGCFREANEARRRLDASLAPRVLDHGMVRDNLLKEEVARNTGWGLAYQDKLARAQEYFENLLSSAPSNAHIHTALAHIYLWRGWQRRSLEEFRVSRTLLPGVPSIDVGYCYSLEENGFRKEARRLAQSLSSRYPRDPDTRKLSRFLEAGNRPAASLKAASVQESPGARETEWTLGYEQPAGLRLKLFAEVFYRTVSETVLNEVYNDGILVVSEERLEEELRRGSLGLGWAASRNTQLTVTASAGADGGTPGVAGEVRARVSDDFAFRGRYDSFSLDVPLRARAFGIEAREATAGVYYHRDEGFAGEAHASSLDMSDENKHWTYRLRADKALTTAASWKTRFSFEGTVETNQNTDVPYFSPDYFSAASLIPGVEHVWFRLYERSLVDRLSAGYGAQWQKGFPSDDTWFGRFEQEYRFSRQSAVQWAA
ncbi:MAG: PgaA family protein, partial [Endomicrobiales bacterium]